MTSTQEISTPANQSSHASIPPITRFIATGCFSGYSPFAPGTAGSLVALLLYAIPGMEQPLVLLVVAIITFIAGVFVSARVENILGDDPSVVVIDEIVGMWISLMFLPKTLLVALASFLLFRMYDIIKPPPARQSERLRHGWGIMLDDVFAGVYANLSVRLMMLIVPWMN